MLHRVLGHTSRRDAAARRKFFTRAARFTPYVCVQAKELTFFVSTKDRLGRGLFTRRWREDIGHLKNAVQALEDHGLSPAGSTLIDVGANIGTTTVSAIRRQGFVRVVALEPEPGNFRLLKVNLLANEIESSVTALEVAVCDREDRVDLVRSATSGGEHALAPFFPVGKARHALSVQAVTIDGLVRHGVIDLPTVGLLWMDVEGAEGLVLDGATTLLARSVPIATSIRPALPGWSETKETLVRLLAGYTHVVHLRTGQGSAFADLEALLNAAKRTEDLLVFRP